MGELEGTVADANGGSEMMVVLHVRWDLGCIRLFGRVSSHNLWSSPSRQRSQRVTAQQEKINPPKSETHIQRFSHSHESLFFLPVNLSHLEIKNHYKIHGNQDHARFQGNGIPSLPTCPSVSGPHRAFLCVVSFINCPLFTFHHHILLVVGTTFSRFFLVNQFF